jgi:hypothetical protein
MVEYLVIVSCTLSANILLMLPRSWPCMGSTHTGQRISFDFRTVITL